MVLQLKHSIVHRHFLQEVTGGSLPILKALYRDGTMYFMLVFAMRLWTGLMVRWKTIIKYMKLNITLQLAVATETLFYLSIFAEYAVTSIAISRLFIHLRSVARRHLSGQPTETMLQPTGATIQRQTQLFSAADPFGPRRQSTPLFLQMPVIERRTEITYN